MLSSSDGNGRTLRAVQWLGGDADEHNALRLCPAGTRAEVLDDGTLVLVLPGERHCLPSARKGEWLVSMCGGEPYPMLDSVFWKMMSEKGFM